MSETLKRAIVMRPGEEAEETMLTGSFEDLMELVDGVPEFTYPLSDTICFVSNDCAKINQLPLNRAIRNEEGKIVDIYAGTILAFHIEEERDDWGDLTDAEVELILERYGKAETGWKTADFANNGLLSTSGETEVHACGSRIFVKYGIKDYNCIK